MEISSSSSFLKMHKILSKIKIHLENNCQIKKKYEARLFFFLFGPLERFNKDNFRNTLD
jgi:hypothetical protein